ncbi:hypothetical protein [Paractinoplanes rishiriensis]|nr:hypothetical protein [Actinoplanes rishiriensis]
MQDYDEIRTAPAIPAQRRPAEPMAGNAGSDAGSTPEKRSP